MCGPDELESTPTYAIGVRRHRRLGIRSFISTCVLQGKSEKELWTCGRIQHNRGENGSEFGVCSDMTHPNMKAFERPVTSDGSAVQQISGVLNNSTAQKAPSERDLADTKSAVIAKLVVAVGKDAGAATDRDWFLAAAFAIRDRIVHRWLATERASKANGSKRVYYLSLPSF